MRRFPLRAIIILRRATPAQIAAGRPNTIRPLTPQEAAPTSSPKPTSPPPSSATGKGRMRARAERKPAEPQRLGAQVMGRRKPAERTAQPQRKPAQPQRRHPTAQPNYQLSIKETAFALRLKTLDLMSKLSHLPIYELHCTISQAAVDLTLAALQENTPK